MNEFRFACQSGCTACCRRRGFVYLTPEDLERAARHMGMTGEAFERRYVYRTRHLLRLRKPRGLQCPFLEAEGCRIHPDKPTHCRLYPFWPDYVEKPAAWRAESKHCPGIGVGPVIQIGTALEVAEEMRRAYPTLYAPQAKKRRRQKSAASSVGSVD